MKRTLLTLLCAAATMAVMAVPAPKGGIVVKQADGSTLTIYQHGDEYYHWTTDAQGQWIERNAAGMWQSVSALSQDEIQARRQAAIHRMPTAQQTTGVSRNPAPHGLCILISYTDCAFSTPVAEIDSMLNGQNYQRFLDSTSTKPYAVGSARQYYQDQSYGEYNPHFEVVGPIMMDNNVQYYGGSGDLRAYAMIEEACRKAHDSCGVDFSIYDNDEDGKVDFVYVLYAGYGEADSPYPNTIWPHSSDLSYARTVTLDGVTIGTYACSNELKYDGTEEPIHNGIGTFVHEFSHVIGLPDLYCTSDNGTHKTMGEWDIMDQGPYNNNGNTPPAYSGYERFFMGWITPRIVTEQEAVTLKSLNDTAEVLLVSKTGQHNLDGLSPNPKEFYMLETRVKTGWDTYIPGSGLMVTKINYDYTKWAYNTVNNKKSELGVDLIEADGKAPTSGQEGWSGKADDVFPGQNKKYKEYTIYSKYYLTEIKYWSSGKITMKLGIGSPYVALEELTQSDETILAIYDVLGKQLSTCDLNTLGTGLYIVRTNKGTKKVMLP